MTWRTLPRAEWLDEYIADRNRAGRWSSLTG